MLLQVFFRSTKELHGHQAEPLLLKAFGDRAHQGSLHAVWLHNKEDVLKVAHGLKAHRSAGSEMDNENGEMRKRRRRRRM